MSVMSRPSRSEESGAGLSYARHLRRAHDKPSGVFKQFGAAVEHREGERNQLNMNTRNGALRVGKWANRHTIIAWGLHTTGPQLSAKRSINCKQVERDVPRKGRCRQKVVRGGEEEGPRRVNHDSQAHVRARRASPLDQKRKVGIAYRPPRALVLLKRPLPISNSATPPLLRAVFALSFCFHWCPRVAFSVWARPSQGMLVGMKHSGAPHSLLGPSVNDRPATIPALPAADEL